jgi:RNA:NAD 2'-phosphotransferase (TPT1/KptA family)
MEGITINEMSKLLKIPPKTVAIRIHRAGIKPMTRQAVYASDTPEKIKGVIMGRPKKPETRTAKKPAQPRHRSK